MAPRPARAPTALYPRFYPNPTRRQRQAESRRDAAPPPRHEGKFPKYTERGLGEGRGSEDGAGGRPLPPGPEQPVGNLSRCRRGTSPGKRVAKPKKNKTGSTEERNHPATRRQGRAAAVGTMHGAPGGSVISGRSGAVSASSASPAGSGCARPARAARSSCGQSRRQRGTIPAQAMVPGTAQPHPLPPPVTPVLTVGSVLVRAGQRRRQAGRG